MRLSFHGYFWFILKNVIGWTLMLVAIPLGVVVPGPGGLPAFLIGFALVTFPGKRRLTARIMRGRRMQIEAQVFTFITSLLALLVMVALLMVAFSDRVRPHLQHLFAMVGPEAVVGFVACCLLAAAVTWLMARLTLRLMNVGLRLVPRMRRWARPWLRQQGFKLLPPRHRRASAAADAGNEEILEIHERHHDRLRAIWAAARPWLRRAVSLAITVAIFIWILKPLVDQWSIVKTQILSTSPLAFLGAAVMFAAFLCVCRAFSWRWVLIGFGHRLPLAVAARIWSMSELARYLPGSVWQVIGRIYLVRPYGVSGSHCSTSQVLELTVFLLANVIVAVTCLVYFGFRRDLDGSARFWLWTAMALVPTLALLLHPRVFYGIANAAMRRLNKPPITTRLSGSAMIGLLVWAVLGLMWQSLAVWLITSDVLDLDLSKWWVVAGAYSLSWCAGFLAVWAPGGIGVREVVFMAIMLAVLPQVRSHYADRPLEPLLAFLSVLLRVWSVAGELILASLAIGFDFRGALGHPDAPGRIRSPN
jgi:hypothetical protein